MSANASNLVTLNSTESEFAEKRTDITTKHRSLYSRKDIEADQVIAPFGERRMLGKPNYLTIQISDNEHIELFPEYLECINHSCDPNCFFDTAKRQLVALKHIKEGEEFTFFYPSAEWDMDQAFQCNCNTWACIGVIKGAKYLTAGVINRHRFTDFIAQKLRLERGFSFPALQRQAGPPLHNTSQL